MGSDDSVEAHVADSLTAGDGLCRREVVEFVVESGPRLIEELIALGVEFTLSNKDDGEKFDLGREGGHSVNRVVHARDLTGREIERALLDTSSSAAFGPTHASALMY